MTTPEQREAILSGLEETARFLREHPELPVSRHWTLTYHAEIGARNDEEGRAQVDAAASVLNRNPTGTAHYRATRKFGGVAYEVLHIAAQEMRDWRAQTSYHSNLRAGEALPPAAQEEGGQS